MPGYTNYKQSYGDQLWHTKLNAFIDAVDVDQTNLNNLVANWAVQEYYLVYLPQTPTYISDTQFSVPGNYVDRLAPGTIIHAFCGTDGIKIGAVSTSSYGAGVTTVTLTSSILTSNLQQIYTVALRDGLYPTGPGYVVATDYGSPGSTTLDSALTAIGSAERVLILGPGDWGRPSVTVPANVTLMFMAGATLDPGASDLSLPPVEVPGRYQVFAPTGAGKVIFNAPAQVRPEWWGAVGNGSTIDDTAIQAAIDAVETYGGVVHLSRIYGVENILHKNKVCLRGEGFWTGFKVYTTSGYTISLAEAIFGDHDEQGYLNSLENFWLDATSNTNNITLFYNRYSFNKANIDRVLFAGNPAAEQCGIHMIFHDPTPAYNKIYHQTIRNCTFSNLNSPNGMIYLEGEASSGLCYNNDVIMSNLFDGEYQCCIKSTGAEGLYILYNCFNPPTSGNEVSLYGPDSSNKYHLNGGEVFRIDIQDAKYCHIANNWFEHGGDHGLVRILTGYAGQPYTTLSHGTVVENNPGLSYYGQIADMSWSTTGSTEGVAYTRVSDTSITVTGDMTSTFAAGNRIYLHHSSGWYSAYIMSSTYTTATTITIDRAVATSDGTAYVMVNTKAGPFCRTGFINSWYSHLNNLLTYKITNDGNYELEPWRSDVAVGLYMKRRTVGDRDYGKALKIEAGGAKSESTDQNGGILQLKSGTATGNGGSWIQFYAVNTNQGAGTTDRTAQLVGEVYGNGVLRLYQVLTSHPATSSTAAQLYAANISSAGVELWVKDGAGNTTQLSPHNFEALPNLPDGVSYPWVYRARNEFLGKEITVDMAGAVRELEKLTGKQFIYEGDIPKQEWDEKEHGPMPQSLVKLIDHVGRLQSKLGSDK